MTRRAGEATRNLRIERITTAEAAHGIADEWNVLASRAGASPFALPAMALAWWRHLGKGRLRIVTARSASGDLVGLAPFHERRLAGLDVVRPLGHGLGAIASTLAAPVKADVAGVLLAELSGGSRTVVHLPDAPLDDPLIASSRHNDEMSMRATLHDECPFITLGGLASSGELLGRADHSKLRKLLARTDRSLVGREVQVDIATAPDQALAAFDRLGELYDAAEAANPRAHLGRGPLGDFFRDALAALAERSQLAVITLLIDGNPAAFDVYVVNGSVGYAILGRYHPDHAASSPGHLLLRAGVDWAIEAGLGELDLQLGSDPYKLSWATGSRDTFEVIITQPHRLAVAGAILQGVESAHALRRRAIAIAAR